MQKLTVVLGAIAAVLILAGVGWLGYTTLQSKPTAPEIEPVPVVEDVLEAPYFEQSIIGTSIEGRPIEAYRFGTGSTALMFVGGIHGGYEWNSTLLAWQAIERLTTNPSEVPPELTVYIIPALNPDGLALVVGTSSRFTLADVPNPNERVAAGRFNANEVDLNRNFDCNWAPESTWRSQPVSAGTAPFSEPEAAAFRDFALAVEPAAVAFWHSRANNVYGSACNNGVLTLTNELGERYASAADYGWVRLFDAYPITGDVEGWLASVGIAAVTVELESANQTEWDRNWAGMQSWFSYFSPPVLQ